MKLLITLLSQTPHLNALLDVLLLLPSQPPPHLNALLDLLLLHGLHLLLASSQQLQVSVAVIGVNLHGGRGSTVGVREQHSGGEGQGRE